MKNKKIIIPLILLILALIIVVIVVIARPKPGGIAGSGMIEVEEVQVASKIGGQISSLRVDEGSRVEAGDTLAVLDHRELDAQEKVAQAGLAVAEQTLKEVQARKKDLAKNLERMRNLHATGDIPDKDWDNIETQYEVLGTQEDKAQAGLKAARAQIELVQTQLANARLLSPIGGVVLARNYEPGELAFPGAPILKIGNLKSAWLKIYVPERQMGRVRLGAPATVSADAYPRQKFAGKVTWIAREAEFTPKNIQVKEERSQLVFAVKIAIDNRDEKLMPGMPADAEILEDGGN
jgi:HlyD family secretion protein